jgi:hypothetical protein
MQNANPVDQPVNAFRSIPTGNNDDTIDFRIAAVAAMTPAINSESGASVR